MMQIPHTIDRVFQKDPPNSVSLHYSLVYLIENSNKRVWCRTRVTQFENCSVIYHIRTISAQRTNLQKPRDQRLHTVLTNQ